ncbi:mycofactocin-coupled SDR family oxidoreductase [Jatrophihabitans fulvus]
MARVEGKVAFITGAARGQGRSHAVRLAEEGADIIAIDICAPVKTNIAKPATEEDLAETVRQVEALDRRIVARTVDVRDFDALSAAVTDGVAQLGRLDVVVANAVSWSHGLTQDLSEAEWSETLDVAVTGVWNTCRATLPTLLSQGQGGSIVITSSSVAIKAAPNMAHYVSAKHALVGLMKSLALENAAHSIRVNTIHPGPVNTDLIHNQTSYDLFAPDLPSGNRDVFTERLAPLLALPIPWLESIDISNAVLFLASDEARYVTGTTMVVDGGATII